MAFVPISSTSRIAVIGNYATEVQIVDLIKIYQSGCPDYGESTRDHSFRNAINEFRTGFYDRDDTKFLSKLKTNLEYRLDVVKKADKYVDMLGLPRPGGSSCSEWDSRKWEADTGHEEEIRCCQLRNFFQRHFERLLFPTPLARRETDTYGKGGAFVFAALYSSGWSREKIESRIIQLLAQIMSESAVHRRRMLRMVEKFREEDEEEYENDDLGETWCFTVARATPKVIELLKRKSDEKRR